MGKHTSKQSSSKSKSSGARAANGQNSSSSTVPVDRSLGRSQTTTIMGAHDSPMGVRGLGDVRFVPAAAAAAAAAAATLKYGMILQGDPSLTMGLF
ncbi:uncharacterized protein BDZ83DRAFT_755875 [Colletotrichum acutatum]|uniref:Uncharacterized protein n=1 Tax=Glomerella acutata TaxID=27357 RepID=A0AAD8UFS7_GLOAC|nr:uncharacterized protein BDZ83DRAFT_755875 [Colletotrichum acutatum]KAK1716796.1 hypothetical protein BDZ83DRAFT_755875 [Colletotrichum acutatum]